MPRPLLVFEDLSRTSRRFLFRFLGVDWQATPFAWVAPLFWCGLGLLAAGGAVLDGLVWGLLLYLCNLLHSVGHILAGHLVGAPMNANLLTATRDVNVYRGDRAAVPDRVRVGRSLGGPAANLLAGALAWWAWRESGAELPHVFALFNLLIGVWTLFPVPTMDGWVVWGSLVRALRRR